MAAPVALTLMAAGVVVGAVGSIIQGNEEKKQAEEQATHNEEISNKQYELSKSEATAKLEELRLEERKAKGNLLQGSAHAGIKIDRSQIQNVSRSGVNSLVKNVGDNGNYTGGTTGEARSTIEALSSDISRQITNEEKSVMRNLSSAKLGLDDALFNAQMLRKKGQMAQIASWFDAGSTILTGAAGIYSTGMDWKNKGYW